VGVARTLARERVGVSPLPRLERHRFKNRLSSDGLVREVIGQMLFTMMNFARLVVGTIGAVWVWRDARRLRNPWAPTWALATLCFFALALPAYLLHTRVRKVSPQ